VVGVAGFEPATPSSRRCAIKMAGLDGLPDAAERLNADAMAVHAVIRDARIGERANIGRAKSGAAIRLAEGPRQELATAIGPPRHWRGR
jgi:hypothetical protein